MIIPTSDQNDHRSRPYVTCGLILVNLFVFFATSLSLDAEEQAEIWRWWGFVPTDASPVTLITSQFLHAGWLHLLGNALVLWIFGDNLEDWLGHLGFLGFYLSMGALACLAHQLLHPDTANPVIGASGAISGVMGGYLVLLPRNRVRFWLLLGFFFFHFELPAAYAIGMTIVGDLIVSVLAADDGVAHAAHLGGFAAGAVLVWALRRLAFRPRALGQFGGIDVGAPEAAAPEGAARAHPIPGLEDERKLAPLVAAGSIDSLLRATIAIAGSRRVLTVSDEFLWQLASTFTTAGHETVAANLLERLIVRHPEPDRTAAAHLALARLYSGPLLDVPQARNHAALALSSSTAGSPTSAEAKRLAAQLPAPPELDHGAAPPPAVRARCLRVVADGLEVTTDRGVHNLRWVDLVLASATFAPVAVAPSEVMRSSTTGRPGTLRLAVFSADRPPAAQGLRVRATVEICARTSGKIVRYHASEAAIDTTLLEGDADQTPPAQRLAREILAHDELLYVTNGVIALAGLASPLPFLVENSANRKRQFLYWWRRYLLTGRA